MSQTNFTGGGSCKMLGNESNYKRIKVMWIITSIVGCNRKREMLKSNAPTAVLENQSDEDNHEYCRL